MSLPISVYREGRFRRFLKLNKAQRKVLSGRYRWRDASSIEEVEAHLVRCPSQRFVSGPAASFRDWQPRPSAGFLVMQLNTVRAKSEKKSA